MSDRRPGRFALPALLGGALGIAFSPIFVRLSEVGPLATAFHRIFLALPLLWMWRRSEGSAGKPVGRAGHGLLLAAGLFFVGDLACWHGSLLLTRVANATLFANFAPIYVTLFSFLLFKERPTPIFLTGLAAAGAGAFCLIRGSVGLGAKSLQGDALAILTGGFYAAYLMAIGRLRERFSTGTILWWTGVTSAVGLFILAALCEGRLLPQTPRGWGLLLALAWVAHVGGQGLIAYALAYLPVTFSSVGLLLQAAGAALLAWLMLGEALGTIQLVGGALILAGIVLARFGTLAKR